MNYKIRILSDVMGVVNAVVDVEGVEYKVKVNSLHMTTRDRNRAIRDLAIEKHKKNSNNTGGS